MKIFPKNTVVWLSFEFVSRRQNLFRDFPRSPGD